jgi:hypothetical protein
VLQVFRGRHRQVVEDLMRIPPPDAQTALLTCEYLLQVPMARPRSAAPWSARRARTPSCGTTYGR